MSRFDPLWDLLRVLAIGMAILGLFTDSSYRLLFAIFMWIVVDSRKDWGV